MHWADGTTYEGEWMKGVQTGKGRLKLPDGTLKVGIFKNNIIVEEHISEISPYAVKLLAASDSSKKLTELHESLLEC
jgi:hypothetical protein